MIDERAIEDEFFEDIPSMQEPEMIWYGIRQDGGGG